MFKKIKNKLKSSKLKQFASKRPLLSFVIVLTLLVVLILISNWIQQPSKDINEKPQEVKKVEIYQLNGKELNTSAKVVNQGVVTVVAQSGGVVQKVNVRAGQKVGRGQSLVSLSTNYQGDNIAALQEKIAQESFLTAHANLWDQQKIQEISQDLSDRQTDKTISNTSDSWNVYNIEKTKDSTDLQADIGARATQLQYDSAETNYKVAQVSASLMRPASPFYGTLEKVFVKEGDLIGAGQPIAIIRSSNSDSKVKLTVSLPGSVIQYLDQEQEAQFIFDGQSYSATFDFIPGVPTSGNIYNLDLTVKDKTIAGQLPNQEYLKLTLPLTTNNQHLIPLNAVYQTQDKSYLYIAKCDESDRCVAIQKEVELGEIVGNLVLVTSGLEDQQEIILTSGLLDQQLINIQ